MENKLIIVGAGAFSVVVAEAALNAGFKIFGFADDNKSIGTKVFQDYSVTQTTASIFENNSNQFTHFVVAIGNNEVRKSLFEKLLKHYQPVNIVHPKAVVSSTLQIGNGNVILAGAVVNASTKIGDNNIVNSLVLLDHDTVVGSHCYIAQGVIVGSNVEIGDSYMTELGAGIKSFSKLG